MKGTCSVVGDRRVSIEAIYVWNNYECTVESWIFITVCVWHCFLVLIFLEMRCCWFHSRETMDDRAMEHLQESPKILHLSSHQPVILTLPSNVYWMIPIQLDQPCPQGKLSAMWGFFLCFSVCPLSCVQFPFWWVLLSVSACSVHGIFPAFNSFF